MEKLSRNLKKNLPLRPVKIAQFGEGNFLRCFVDNFIQILNDKNLINAGVSIIQPRPEGMIEVLKEQDFLYTQLLEGVEDGHLIKQTNLISIVSDVVNPYTQLDKYIALAQNPDLQIVISNTTEAGIVYVEENIPDFKHLTQIPDSFPGKLLFFLYKRYSFFKTPLGGDNSKTLEIVPCELIDYNGTNLYNILLKLARYYELSARFIDWLQHCRFYNTLVDRIVPGFPRDEIKDIYERLGYIDNLVVKGEIFHLWVIEGPKNLSELLPFAQTQIHAYYVDDITPYKQQKVKILNGSHTALVPIAYLMGIRTVKDALDNANIKSFVHNFLTHDVIDTIKLDKEVVESFAGSVLERFANPYIKHLLSSIMLNSVAKFKSRNLPSIIDSLNNGIVPKYSFFALAALLVLYRGKDDNKEIVPLNDEANVLNYFKDLWAHGYTSLQLVKKVTKGLFESEVLYKNSKLIASYVDDILKLGTNKALEKLLK